MSNIEKYVRQDMARLRENATAFGFGVSGIAAVALLLNPLWYVSAGAGLFVFAATKMAIPFTRGRRQKKMIKDVPGVTYGMYDQYLHEGHLKLKQLKDYLRKVPYGDVREKLKRISHTTQQILDDLEEDPRKVKKARQFLNYYLESFNTIMKKYVTISAYQYKDHNTKKVLAEVEDSLDSLEAAFSRQLIALRDKNVLELDVELAVLKKTMDMDVGIGGPADTYKTPPILPGGNSASATDEPDEMGDTNIFKRPGI
ncbi:MAG: hypothetical protein GY765_07625 [bacterium]|nr:hypothetical protein [bacterium]